jgi:SAM-dependent methyltransferase
VSEIHLADVWRAYEERHATFFSKDVIARYGSGPVALRRCGRCDLDWFDPPLEGDAAFYSELFSGGIRYEPWRWEFDRAIERIPDGARVVEVGAGKGAFLRSILRRCHGVEAIDRNPDVAAELRAMGIEVSDADVREDALARPGRADVVCAFQVLEHVADVRGFLSALATIAKPGGEVLVSVPNRDRFRNEWLTPMDCPPHHLSRWSPRQFAAAADVVGLDLVFVDHEPASVSYARARRQQPVRNALGPVIGRSGAALVARATTRLLMPKRRHERLAAKGHFRARGEYGHTTFAALRRRV